MCTKTNLLNQKGNSIFLETNSFKKFKVISDKAIGSNTYRAFTKNEKYKNQKCAIKNTFTEYFNSNENEIIQNLKEINDTDSLHKYSNNLCKSIRPTLAKILSTSKKDKNGNVITINQLAAYNKLRKPVDLFIEHLVACCEDLAEHRSHLVPLLFLPLDSQIFNFCYVFNDDEIENFNLQRGMSFGDIKEEEDYDTIQKFLTIKANSIGLYNRIYFDMLWGNRYKRKEKNLIDISQPLKQTN